MSAPRHWTQEVGEMFLSSTNPPASRDREDVGCNTEESDRPILSNTASVPYVAPIPVSAEASTSTSKPVTHDKATQTIEITVGSTVAPVAEATVATRTLPEAPIEVLDDTPAPEVSPASDLTLIPEESPVPEPPAARRKHMKTDAETGEEYATLQPHGLGEVTTKIDNHWMYVFFRFCAERHRMQELRDIGVPRDQLSKDETMQKEHIGNIYREMDPGSKRMKEEIIANGDQSHEEICFRIFLFSGFYVPATWQALVDGLGEIPNWKNYARDFEKYETILCNRSMRDRQVIYTSSFQLVPPTKYFGTRLPHFAATLRFIRALMESGLPQRLLDCKYAVDASHILQAFPTLGGFLSLNTLCSLNDSPHMKLYYRNFASCGPGSRQFMQRMFGKSAINSVAMEAAGLKWLYDHQWTYWARIGEDPPHAWAIGLRPGMRVLDFENALCWAHRYVNAYLSKGHRSLADLPPPEYDPETVSYSSMPAWCDEERHADDPNRAAFESDYEEEEEKRRQAALDREDEDVPDECYEVEKIVTRKGHRTDKDGLYRVRWKGYPPEDDTWERASALGEGAKEALQEWLNWEEAVWGTIDRITRELPYKKPEDAPIMKYEIMDEPRSLVRQRSASGARESPRRISKRRKSSQATPIKTE